MVKVQIPGSTGAITLRPATSTVTLAPKPSLTTGSTSPTSGQTLTAIKLASVANPTSTQQVVMKGSTLHYTLSWLTG